jgi:peptidoglycan hydrolase FlgJ
MTDRLDSANANSYLDFKGLGELRAQAGRGDDAALRKAAQQFEAFFIQSVMQTMREANFKGGLIESNAMDTFQSMHDKELSVQMARRGSFGIADMLVEQMSRRPQVAAADALAARERAMGQGKGALPLATSVSAMPLAREAKALELRPSRSGMALPADAGRGLPLARTAARADFQRGEP